MSNVNPNIIDIDLSIEEKKCFRFGKDDSRVVYLNTSDMTILARINETYPKLVESMRNVALVTEGISNDTEDTEKVMNDFKTMGERLKEIDTEMRSLIDYIFDAPVSAAAAPSGSMYDPFNGSFRYEYIITAVLNQYGNDFTTEFSKFKDHLNETVKKYGKEY